KGKPHESHPDVTSGGTKWEKARGIIKSLIFFPFLLFVIAYVISVSISATPHNSRWGGYDRMQGLYTNASFWVVFLITALNIKTREQIDRLISAIIFTSAPIVAYCFIQRFKLDPVPWQQMDPSTRVSATMGNPIFLSAYLIIAIPLTISRFVQGLKDNKKSHYLSYGILVILQIFTVFLSQSRGPMAGMFISILVFLLGYSIIYKKKILLWTLISGVVIGGTFLFLFNIPHIASFKKVHGPTIEKITVNKSEVSKGEYLWHKTFGRLMDVPYLRQLGRFLETQKMSSGRTRMLLWQGVFKLILDKDEKYRFFFGYGPESLSTVYYKNYEMELASLEGVNVHADRSHNHYLDVWVMHGLFGLIAYLSLLGAIFLTAYKAVRQGLKMKSVLGDSLTIMTLGLITALIAHLVEIGVGIAIVSTYTHFWVITAAIYASYKISVRSAAQSVSQSAGGPADLKGHRGILGEWQFYLLIIYGIFTIIIAFILFQFSFPESKIITPDVKSAKDAILTTFFIWIVFGFIAGIFLWSRYFFWSFVGQTLIMTVIMVRKYWPDDTTNTDALIIYSWLWILTGIIVGTLSLKRAIKPLKLWNFSNVLLWLVMLIAVVWIISSSNLALLRADGFYKFCFSYDMSAEEAMRQGARERAYEIRLACIKYFQNALMFAPKERAYLNGAGRNFLELAKLVLMLKKETANKLSQPPSEDEMIQMEHSRYRDFSQRDFALCSFSCIKRAWELDPNNFERIIALIRIYRYWGDLDRDITKFQEARRLCDLARKASPQNTKTDDEIRELEQRLPPH
ncbi:MAG: O-antigen ligase family protein, partial [Planctomycetota bacterium]|nr:O-antigen ligase family protein [Planctomycetota bacterium]